MPQTATTPPAATKPAHYRMPSVDVGDPIYWYPNANPQEEPWPAFVTNIGHNCLCISFLEKGVDALQVRDSVRHITDPTLAIPESRVDGAWEFHPKTMRLLALEAALVELAADVGKKLNLG